MHIVFICSEFPLHRRPTGGFGSYVDNLSKALVGKNIHVTIICQNIIGMDIAQGNRRIIAIASPNFPFKKWLSRSRMSFLRRAAQFINYPLGFSLELIKTLAQVHKENPVDLVEGGDFGAELFFLLLFKIESIKYIIKLHTPSFVIREFNQESKTLFYQVLERLEEFCLKRADAVYSPSETLLKIVTEKYHIPVKEVIPYPTFPMIKTKGIKRDPNMILYVGKLQYKKGVYELVYAFSEVVARNPKAKMVFIGPDTLRYGHSTKKELRVILRSKGVYSQVTFISPIPQNKLGRYYLKAGMIVIPSHWENFPNVLLEAGCYGTPVIATKVGGITEIINHGKTGLFIQPQSVKQIAQAIHTFIQNPALAKSVAIKFKLQIQKTYSPKSIAELTLGFYDGLLRLPTAELGDQ